MKKDIIYLIIIGVLFGACVCFGTLYFTQVGTVTDCYDDEDIDYEEESKQVYEESEIDKLQSALKNDGFELTDFGYDNSEENDIIYTKTIEGKVYRINISDKKYLTDKENKLGSSKIQYVDKYYWSDDMFSSDTITTNSKGEVTNYIKREYNFKSGTGNGYDWGKSTKEEFVKLIEGYGINLEKIK